MNQHTNSAAEMVVNFAVESRFAMTVGVKTPGNVLGARIFVSPATTGCGSLANRVLQHFRNAQLAHFAGVALHQIQRTGLRFWYTPKGQSVEGTGVTPDVMIEVSTEALRIGIDNQMQKAIEIVAAL